MAIPVPLGGNSHQPLELSIVTARNGTPAAGTRRVLAWGGLCGMLWAGTGNALTLEAAPALSTDGVVVLSWQPAGQPVVLERASRADFRDARVLYRGTDGASLRSGLSDGSYHYRVAPLIEGAAGPWSGPVTVRVEHHQPRRAWALFALGALVFVSTLALILGGTRRGASRD